MAAGDEVVDSGNVNIPTEDQTSHLAKSGDSPQFTLKILVAIKEAQLQHGLRHGDFQRYRSYCSRRLRRIRKSLHFVQGNRSRYQPKKVTKEILNDSRYLHIPLVTAERAWGYAMQLKQEANTEPRKRFHLINRLKKSAKSATFLETLCVSSKCDARTKLEGQAYNAWMQASLLFELKDWQSAMQHYQKAQTIYEKLSSAVNEEEQQLYQQRVDELAPNIRYCAYNIGDKTALNDLKKMRRAAGEDFLAENIDTLIAQTRERQAATLSEVSWQLRTVPVKQEKVRIFLLNAQEIENEISRAKNTASKVSVYESLLLECKDALQILRDELNNDPNFKNRQIGDVQLSSLHYLYSYILYLRLTFTVQRNLFLIENLKNSVGSQDNNEVTKVVKPQDYIRLYETIIQNLGEISSLSGIEEGSEIYQNALSQVLAYKAFRCYYIAQTFRSSKQWGKTIALYERAQKYCQQALPLVNKNLKKLAQELQDLLQQIDGQKYSAHALSILGTDDIADQVQQLKLEDKKLLIDRLDLYYKDPSLKTAHPAVAKFPPDYQPIPCKPLFFDLALNHVTLPSLDDRLEAKKGGGLTGMVKGWLWGGGKK